VRRGCGDDEQRRSGRGGARSFAANEYPGDAFLLGSTEGNEPAIFTREEAGAIVVYLQHKRDAAQQGTDHKHIDVALGLFWKERAHVAPERSALQNYWKEQEEYLAAAKRERDGSV